ncbi:hypothetical protein C3R44_23590, partial [Mycobacterium tuberculosis]
QRLVGDPGAPGAVRLRRVRGALARAPPVAAARSVGWVGARPAPLPAAGGAPSPAFPSAPPVPLPCWTPWGGVAPFDVGLGADD